MLVRLYSLDGNGLCVEVRTIQDSSRKVAGATSQIASGGWKEHEEMGKDAVDDLIANGFLDSDYEGSSGDFSSSDGEESESEFSDDAAFETDSDEIDEYFIYEEIDDFDFDDEITENYMFADDAFDTFENYSVYDLVNDPKYQLCIYQRVIVEIDYDFYEIDDECISF